MNIRVISIAQSNCFPLSRLVVSFSRQFLHFVSIVTSWAKVQALQRLFLTSRHLIQIFFSHQKQKSRRWTLSNENSLNCACATTLQSMDNSNALSVHALVFIWVSCGLSINIYLLLLRRREIRLLEQGTV